MYQCILFATLFLSEPFQYKCEIKETRTKLKAIIMPFDQPGHKEPHNVNDITIQTNGIRNRSNIKAKKICTTIWLKKNVQECLSKDEVVIIDCVYDSVTNKMNKLINPYIVIIQQDEVLESYNLKHLKMVNAEVKEKVFNKETTSHYLGCYTDLKRSSCNTIINHMPLKYSEGFCCSCKMATNIKRQLADCQGRSRFKHVIHTTRTYKEELDMVINQLVDNITLTEKTSNITEQIRGGQNCDDKITPRYINEHYRYHESGHCLQFSDLWYDVNKLESAMYHHSVTISIYEKFTRNNKPKYKQIFSKIKLGSKNKNFKNQESTVQANYVGLTFEANQYYSLDVDNDRLLIPRKVPTVIEHLYPQAIDDPKKYLIVNANNISIKGDECNKIGVSYEAFYKQYNRCGVPKSTCLDNQPTHLWKHDMDVMNSGNPGSYFLENFAKFPQKTDILQEMNGTNTLNLLYEMDYTSELLIHAVTDYNSAFSTRSLVEIVEIYSDATKSDQTTIIATIYNIGMKANSFRVQLTQFTLNTSKNMTTIQSHDVQIYPFHRHNYILNYYGSYAKSNINCTLQVLNEWNEIIAWRHVLISEANRCFCVWKCECSCTTVEHQSFRPTCKIISKEHYNGAGFRGALPPITNHNTKLNIIRLTFVFIFFYWIIVLLIGITKAIIGLCYKPVSSFGLHMIFHEKSKNLQCYLEPEICTAYVIMDIDGYAIHPYTKKRTIQLVSKKKEFITNVFYPVLIFISFMRNWCIKRLYINKDNKSNTRSEGNGNICDNEHNADEYQINMDSDDEFIEKISLLSSVKSTKVNQTKTTPSIMDLLFNKNIVYYNNYTMLNNQNEVIYSIAGRFEKIRSFFYFNPLPPTQTYTFDGVKLKKSKQLPPGLDVVIYRSKEEAIKSNEISLSPKGTVINRV